MGVEEENLQKNVSEIVAHAQSIIDGQKNTIESIRKIVNLLHKTPHRDDEIFFPIRGIESETDGYPLGNVRDNYASDYLKRLDKEAEEYLKKVHGPLIEACKNIVHKYGNAGNAGDSIPN